MIDGILNIHKPAGPTSFTVVSAVRRLTGEKKAGHAGTLDPAASGVLPVCLGKATRVAEYLMESPKTYRAEIEMGKTTDTYDSEGTVVTEKDASDIQRSDVETALQSFLGEIRQVPPIYSALKQNGRPSYELARAGIEVRMQSRPVRVYSIDVLDWQPPVATVDVTCGKGTYIRSLAHDLGQKLGCGAYMKSLVRRRYGVFSLDNAVTPEELGQAVARDDWYRLIHPPDSVLLHLDAVVVNDDTCMDIKNGRMVDLGPAGVRKEVSEKSAAGGKAPETVRCRVYTLDGRFAGVLRYEPRGEKWQPEKVFLRG
jgi:tRNA pseudouridine55 synthase